MSRDLTLYAPICVEGFLFFRAVSYFYTRKLRENGVNYPIFNKRSILTVDKDQGPESGDPPLVNIGN